MAVELNDQVVEMSCELVGAYVSHNAVNQNDLIKLITDVYGAIKALGKSQEPEVVEKRRPATSVRKSITPDYLICLDDGKKFKSLKRHLAQLGMTPEQYRKKWNLPSDYPMVAPNYSTRRSAMAKNSGLGRKIELLPKASAPIGGQKVRRGKVVA